MSMGVAVCAMLPKELLCCAGLAGNNGKLQSPESSNRRSNSGSRLGTSSCGLRCQA